VHHRHLRHQPEHLPAGRLRSAEGLRPGVSGRRRDERLHRAPFDEHKVDRRFVAYAKANPGRLPTAIGGVGSSNHITPVWFASIAGLDMLYVPFKGSGDSITALLSAQVLFFVDNEPSILPQIKSGKVRPLAVTGPRRSAFLPDIPTMEEVGYKGFIIEPW
jgi:tripartite-type tricarboxylate transporter receptor subunit TctC